MGDLGQKVAAGVVGVVLGWAANGLTLGPRVSAIEQGQARLEASMSRLVDAFATGRVHLPAEGAQ